jgi:tetratricopeptide (TPR) repeat protein
MADEAIAETPVSRLEVISRVENFLLHRRALLETWRAAIDTTKNTDYTRSNIESIASIDIVCRGNPPIHDPNFRQRGLTGDVVSNLRELYDCASTIKSTFDNALIGVAKQLKMSNQMWDGNSPEIAQSGLVLCPLKLAERATDKIRDKYFKVEPGPPESWLYDVVRANFICNTEEQMVAVCEHIQNFPSFEVVRIKNHFTNPLVSGFRDVQLTVRMMVKNKRGHLMYFICEVTVTHVALKDYEVEHNTLPLRRQFFSLFQGSQTKQEGILSALIKCHAEISRIRAESAQLSNASDREKFISQALIVFAEGELRSVPEDGGDDEVLECWVQVLKYLGEHEGAVKIQEKVCKALVNRWEEDSLEVAEGLDELAYLLKLLGKYDRSVTMFEKSIYVRNRIFGDKHPLVANSLCSMASVMYEQKKFATALPLHEQVLLIRRQVYGNKHPDVASSLVHLAGLMEVQGKIEDAKVCVCVCVCVCV